MTPREKTLYYLGFGSYKAYLRSPLWKSIRKRVYGQKGSACSLCGRKATEIHHRSYDRLTLLGLILTYLEPICRCCHQNIEVTPHGRKRGRKVVEHLFQKKRAKLLLRKRRKPGC